MQIANTKGKRALISLFSFTLFLTILSLIPYFDLPDLCLIHHFTGIHCPGCGITRALLSVIHLDFYQAFRYHNLFFIIIILLSYHTITKIDCFINQKKRKPYPEKLIYALIIIFVVYGVLRNIPGLEYLIPTTIH